ncbi:hypothetical protein AX17_003574 [Amanita inopinata Kibby_2008]|nr:hypothetical protein AX17_003574 [Amanita inopinata Kibby_2008]
MYPPISPASHPIKINVAPPPLNEMPDLMTFPSPSVTMAQLQPHESFINPYEPSFPYPEDEAWINSESMVPIVHNVESHLLAPGSFSDVQPFQSYEYPGGQFSQQQQPPQTLYTNTTLMDFPSSSLSPSTPSFFSSYYNLPYTASSGFIPPTPSATYSPQAQLSPGNTSGYISSMPTTPNSVEFSPFTSSENRLPTSSNQGTGHLSHQDQVTCWKLARRLPIAGTRTPFVPQKMYKPHNTSDVKRYIEEVGLDPPIYFWMTGPEECGISLTDALHSRTSRLLDHDKKVFEGRGPSVSIRLEWPEYRQWSRQIPTKDFRSPPQPITMTKLCKSVAKCVMRFINERQNCILEEGADPTWRVGKGPYRIKLDDLVLVSLHHVSMGSWQPQLRLRANPLLGF